MKSFKDRLGRLWISCNECQRGVDNLCRFSARCRPRKGYCRNGKMKKG